jgi:hypothetical protein
LTPTPPTAREIAIARVRDHIAPATQEAADAGFVIAINIGKLIDDIINAYELDELKLPRYYPDDEGAGQAYLLGTERQVNPDTGQPDNVYTWWRTGLPGGRMLMHFGAGPAAQAARSDGSQVACLVNPDVADHLFRLALAASAHSRANPAPPGGLTDTTDQATSVTSPE